MSAKELTDDFVEAFENADPKSPTMRLIARFLPMGVDPDDERVVAIVAKARAAGDE